MLLERFTDPSIVYAFMNVNAEYPQDVQCCLATNQKDATPLESQMRNLSLTSSSVDVSAGETL